MRTIFRAAGVGAAMILAQPVLAQSVPPNLPGFTLSIKGGTFFGPGNKGDHPFPMAEVRNVFLTGPLQGFIPFFNNGAAEPNVIAEVLQGGPVDGFTSDGRPINENIDTALRLLLEDPDTGATANIMVVSVQSETLHPDEKANLVFDVNVVADPGEASLVQPFVVHFSTGARTIPLSRRTQQGQSGGHDQAGSLPSGFTLIGKIGDFDHDGFLDGELVQAENSPPALVLAQGDPLGQRRPWVSNIPSTPDVSLLLNLSNIVQNFPEPMFEALFQGRGKDALDYGFDITGRLNAALYDTTAIVACSTCTLQQRELARRVRSMIRLGRKQIESGMDHLVKRRTTRGEHAQSSSDGPALLEQGLQTLGGALQLVAQAAQSGQSAQAVQSAPTVQSAPSVQSAPTAQLTQSAKAAARNLGPISRR